MSRYRVEFDWPPGVQGEAGCDLDAETWAMAKLQAAMIFAGATFEDAAPIGYRILQNGDTEVYRYPEPSFH